jgi:hypothetical protein
LAASEDGKSGQVGFIEMVLATGKNILPRPGGF